MKVHDEQLMGVKNYFYNVLLDQCDTICKRNEPQRVFPYNIECVDTAVCRN
jgi:hypothetical protein